MVGQDAGSAKIIIPIFKGMLTCLLLQGDKRSCGTAERYIQMRTRDMQKSDAGSAQLVDKGSGGGNALFGRQRRLVLNTEHAAIAIAFNRGQ